MLQTQGFAGEPKKYHKNGIFDTKKCSDLCKVKDIFFINKTKQNVRNIFEMDKKKTEDTTLIKCRSMFII
jgi:hypothetical protein